jgi:hypothetical protein
MASICRSAHIVLVRHAIHNVPDFDTKHRLCVEKVSGLVTVLTDKGIGGVSLGDVDYSIHIPLPDKRIILIQCTPIDSIYLDTSCYWTGTLITQWLCVSGTNLRLRSIDELIIDIIARGAVIMGG